MKNQQENTQLSTDSYIISDSTPTVKERLKTFISDKKKIIISIGFILFLGINILLFSQNTKPIRFRAKASTLSAQIKIIPDTQTLNESGSFQLFVFQTGKSSFIHIEVVFDNNIIQMAEPFIANEKFKDIVKQTSVAEANTSGKFVFAGGIGILNRNNPFGDSYQLGTLFFKPVNKNLETTSIQIPSAKVQIVSPEAREYGDIQTFGAKVTVNFLQSSTTIPTAIQITGPQPTITPFISISPTIKPVSCVPVNGVWQYGHWSSCTAECGTGVQFREATCVGASCGGTCQGESITRQECNTQLCKTKIVVYAAGTKAQNEYPTMQLLIDDKVVAEWKNITGQPKNRNFNEYMYLSSIPVSINQIKVRYINDLKIKGQDRNLRVDKISVNGIIYETESSTTFVDGTFDYKKGCTSGYYKTEWLHCNGFFQYKN